MMLYVDAFLVAATIAVLLAMVLTTLRGKPIVSLSGVRFLRGDPEVSTPFAGPAFVLLGLVSIGDSYDALEPLGRPWHIAALLGVLTGLVGRGAVIWWIFRILSVLAVLTSVPNLFGPGAERPVAAILVLLTFFAGGLLGAFVWPDLRPDTLLAKLCTMVATTRFLIAPGSLDLIGGATSTTLVLLGVAAVWAAVLFALPGPGVSVLLGIGIGVIGLWFGLHTGIGLEFTVVFVVAWLVATAIRSRWGGRRRGSAVRT